VILLGLPSAWPAVDLADRHLAGHDRACWIVVDRAGSWSSLLIGVCQKIFRHARKYSRVAVSDIRRPEK